ncbi:MAG: FHA domain-containing protein, partial [Anaerolineales bacterium]
MYFGSLFVEFPDGRELEFPVNKPRILIGRTPDNDLVISHPTISRRHVRLLIEPDQVFIEDLGSTNGTYFDDQQLDPLQPHPITPQQPIFLGNVRIYYRSSQKTDDIPKEVEDQTNKSRIDFNQEIKSDQFASLIVNGPAEPITPGSTQIAIIHLHNTSISEYEALIRISGLPQNWYSLEHDRLKLIPNEIVENSIYIHPPRLPEVIAGTHTLKVTVYSTHHGRGPSTQAKVEILSYHNLKL